MPKVGMEPIRRDALVKATIAEVGRAGSLDVTVGQIAKRAGVSSALAHHYFGGKEQILTAAMRHILAAYAGEVRAATPPNPDPARRLDGVIAGSFAPSNFRTEVLAAWLTFYGLAQTSAEARRLLAVYQRRLRSNLLVALRPLTGPRAEAVAEDLAAFIDGVYLRVALAREAPDGSAAVARTRALAAALIGERHDH